MAKKLLFKTKFALRKLLELHVGMACIKSLANIFISNMFLNFFIFRKNYADGVLTVTIYPRATNAQNKTFLNITMYKCPKIKEIVFTHVYQSQTFFSS